MSEITDSSPDFYLRLHKPASNILGRDSPHVGKPTVRCFSWFEVFGVAVLLHVAFAERPAWVEEYAHVVVCVVFEPDADAGDSVES
jgi:hypothetical protein